MRRLKIAIPSTHPIPRWIIAALSLTLPFSLKSTNLPAQSVVLDSLPVYEQSYRQFMVRKWTAERKEFLVVNKKKWWYYLPSVGYAFGLPTVNLNTGVLAQIDRDRAVMAARLTALDSRYQVEFAETLQQIRVEYRKLLVRHAQIERERLALKRLYGIHAIYAEAFNQQTMSPEESLKHAYELDNAVNQFKNREAELTVAMLDFFVRCRYNLPEKPLVELASDEGCPATEPRAGHPTDVTVISEVAPPRP